MKEARQQAAQIGAARATVAAGNSPPSALKLALQDGELLPSAEARAAMARKSPMARFRARATQILTQSVKNRVGIGSSVAGWRTVRSLWPSPSRLAAAGHEPGGRSATGSKRQPSSPVETSSSR